MNRIFLLKFHASNVEEFLIGKNVLDDRIFKEALKKLDDVLQPNFELTDTSPRYRKLLAQSLFYKVIFPFHKLLHQF